MSRTTKNMTPIVAAAHATAPLFDLKAGIAKAVALIGEAARSGASLIVFPESFLPGFPICVDSIAPSTRTASSAVSRRVRCCPMGTICVVIQAAAAKHKIFASLGFCEVSSASPRLHVELADPDLG